MLRLFPVSTRPKQPAYAWGMPSATQTIPAACSMGFCSCNLRHDEAQVAKSPQSLCERILPEAVCTCTECKALHCAVSAAAETAALIRGVAQGSSLRSLGNAAHCLLYWASPFLSSLYTHGVHKALHSSVPAAAGGLLDEAQKLQLSGGAAEAHGQVLKWHLLCLHIRGALEHKRGRQANRVSLGADTVLAMYKIGFAYHTQCYRTAHYRAEDTHRRCCMCIWLLLGYRGPNSALCLPLACWPSPNIKAPYKAGARQASLSHRCLTVTWDMAAHALHVGSMLVLQQCTALGLLALLGLSHNRGFGSRATGKIAKCR